MQYVHLDKNVKSALNLVKSPKSCRLNLTKGRNSKATMNASVPKLSPQLWGHLIYPHKSQHVCLTSSKWQRSLCDVIEGFSAKP